MLAETTVQADVGPGDQTGVYYITICNLPFGTSWQQLKDWTRSACVVDHIEVFQNSTSGWVRVKGRDNFDKAWSLLNGGVFNGRSIIASDRNRSHSIKIKELVDTSQMGYSQTPQYHATPPASFGSTISSSVVAPSQYSTTSTSQYYAAGYPQVGGMSYSGHSASTQSYTYQPATATSFSIPSTHVMAGTGDYYSHRGTEGGIEQSTITYSPQYQYENISFTLPDRGHVDLSTYYDGYEGSSAGSYPATEYILTEQRKIHVSPFPQQAKADDVRSWIRRKVDKDMIESMDIPQNNNSKYLRGHAFVIFDSASAASTAMDQLNKSRFQGRRVIARPTVEGVTAEEPGYVLVGSSRCSHGNRPRGEKGEKGERPKHSREIDRKHLGSESTSSTYTSSSSSRKSAQSQSQSYPHSHPERKPSSKRGSSDKKSGKDSGPVIVDGTSRKRDKRR